MIEFRYVPFHVRVINWLLKGSDMADTIENLKSNVEKISTSVDALGEVNSSMSRALEEIQTEITTLKERADSGTDITEISESLGALAERVETVKADAESRLQQADEMA